jgi:hypothetical protein
MAAMDTRHLTHSTDDNATAHARTVTARLYGAASRFTPALEQRIYHPSIVLPLLELQQLTASSDFSLGSVLWALLMRCMRLALDGLRQRSASMAPPARMQASCCKGQC